MVSSSGRVGQPTRVGVLLGLYGNWSIAIVLYPHSGTCRSRSHFSDIVARSPEHIPQYSVSTATIRPVPLAITPLTV